ncbi:MAG: PilZ domain-containing protein [Candidatus Omnitrophica bacterium]|nr:PilZ domain-containing protein [Candidatus Omnitrophota bacterium]
MQQEQEKRKHIRINGAFLISYRILPELPKKYTETVDISEKGFRLEMPELLTPGTALELQIYPYHELRPIKVTAEVVWVEKNKEALFATGMKLVKVSSKNHNRLVRSLLTTLCIQK